MNEVTSIYNILDKGGPLAFSAFCVFALFVIWKRYCLFQDSVIELIQTMIETNIKNEVAINALKELLNNVLNRGH